jgi:Flp pilus assembly protein TadB
MVLSRGILRSKLSTVARGQQQISNEKLAMSNQISLSEIIVRSLPIYLFLLLR